MTLRFALPQPPKASAVQRRRFASLRAIIALMLREMSTTYGRTPGGFLWAIAEPVVGVLMLTYAFSFVMTVPAIGTSFPLFFATGFLPFVMCNTLIGRVGSSLLFSKPLLAYPAATYLDALLARFFVNLIAELLVFYLVMTGIMVFYDTRAVLDIAKIAESLALAALFGFSLGTLNAYLFMRLPLWHVIWSLISRPLFLISGVLFIFNNLPTDLKFYLWFNPLVHVVGMMRAGFYPTYVADYVSPLYVVLVSLVLMLLGLLLLHRDVRRLLHGG